MHALQRFIREQMDDQDPPWQQADLERASGLSKQQISKLMTSKSGRMSRMPADATIAGLARGLGVSENFIRLKVVESMGVDVGDVRLVRETRVASNDELLAEVRRRMTESEAASDGTPIAHNQDAFRLAAYDHDRDGPA